MRAGRLVAIVLLLQVHGQRTARQLAEALETSQRTIRRDLDALCAAGVPLYAQRGRGGGWALLGGHRIDLSGLTASEARSLVLAAAGVPGQQDVDAAVRKVLAAMPEALRDQARAARETIHVDGRGWAPNDGPASETPVGDAAVVVERLRQALEDAVEVDLCYAKPGEPPSWRRVGPLGLVVKRGRWYVVASAASGLRTYRLSRVKAVELTTDAAPRPAGFDLEAAWEASQRAFAALRPPAEVAVELLVDPQVWSRLSGGLGAWWDLVDLGVEPDGRRRARVCVGCAAHAAAELVGYGERVEVLSPPEVCEELAALGRRLVARYSAITS